MGENKKRQASRYVVFPCFFCLFTGNNVQVKRMVGTHKQIFSTAFCQVGSGCRHVVYAALRLASD